MYTTAIPDTISQPFSRFQHKGGEGRAKFWGLAAIIHQSGGGGLRFCNADRRRKERNSRLPRTRSRRMSWPREELQPFRQWCKKVGLSHHARLEGGTQRSESKRVCESKCLHEVEIGKMVFDFDIDNDQLSSLGLWTHACPLSRVIGKM